MLKAINIKWDTDGDMEAFNDLPTEMIVPDELEEMYKKDKEYALEEISDWLSDETGFCHDGFEIEREITKESVAKDLANFLTDRMTTGDAPEIEGVSISLPDWVSIIHSGTIYDEVVIDCVGGKKIELIVRVV